MLHLEHQTIEFCKCTHKRTAPWRPEPAKFDVERQQIELDFVNSSQSTHRRFLDDRTTLKSLMSLSTIIAPKPTLGSHKSLWSSQHVVFIRLVVNCKRSLLSRQQSTGDVRYIGHQDGSRYTVQENGRNLWL